MAIVFRVAYNNNNWDSPCKEPGKDKCCFMCFENILQIIPPNRNDLVCSGKCWEQRLRKEYKWGIHPKGRFYGSEAYPGVKAIFTFKQPNNLYTLWGQSVVSSVDKKVTVTNDQFYDGYSFIHFEPFEPLPREKWVTDLADIKLVGAKWLMGRHRYIDEYREEFLTQLIKGESPEVILDTVSPNTVKLIDEQKTEIPVSIKTNIRKQLEEIAIRDGRDVDELIREAIANWIRGRER